MDNHVVIMFEYNYPGEKLDAAGQVNEVFGPFYSGEVAEAWVETMREKIPNRHWLIAPLRNPKVDL